MRMSKNQIWKHKDKKNIKLETLAKTGGKWDVKILGPKGMWTPQQYSTQFIRAHYEFHRSLVKEDA